MKTFLLVSVLNLSIVISSFASAPFGWTFRSFPVKFYDTYFDYAYRHNGKPSFTIKSVKQLSEENGFATFIQKCSAGNFRGKRVRMTAYVKSSIETHEDLSYSSNEAFLILSDNKNPDSHLSLDSASIQKIKGVTDWKKYEVVTDVPDNASVISYGAMLIGNGQIWLDSLKLEIVDKTISLTWRDALNEFRLYPETLHPNGDFEPANLSFDSINHITNKAPFDNWYINDSTLKYYYTDIDEGTGRNGTNAVTIRSLNGKVQRGKWGELNKNFYAEKFQGRRVKMSAYMHARNLKRWAGIFVWMYGPKGTGGKAIYGFYSRTSIKNVKEWTKCELIFDVPINSLAFDAGTLIDGSGQIWIDDVSFEIIGDAGTVQGKESSIQTEPSNLDFSK